MPKGLTDKREKYIQELIKGKSQREAYRIAFPASVKWLDKTVDEVASRLFNDSKVNARYSTLKDRLIKEAEDDCIITAKQVLQELANIALANGTDFAEVLDKEYPVKDKDGNETGEYKTYTTVDMIPTECLTKAQRSAIAGIEQTQSGIKVKQHDKVKALELLGKHLKLFTEVTEIGNKDGEAFKVQDMSLEEKLKIIESLKQ